jgi:hypothetical protein
LTNIYIYDIIITTQGKSHIKGVLKMKKFKLIGRVYGVEPNYYSWDEQKQYPRYEEIAKVELGTFDFENLSQAEAFFNEHYKALQQGGAIIQVDEKGEAVKGGDFTIFAIKGH